MQNLFLRGLMIWMGGGGFEKGCAYKAMIGIIVLYPANLYNLVCDTFQT